MPATHPFAIKLERAIEHAKRVRDAMKKARAGTKQLYISPGHRVSMATALEFVRACLTKYRLPETTRAADVLASHGRIPQIKPLAPGLFE